MDVDMVEFRDDTKVSLEREKLIGVKPLKEKKCPAPELLPETIESSDFELMIESIDSICNPGIDVNESNPSSATIVIPQAQFPRATNGVIGGAVDSITKYREVHS
ncbi:hypothetical protein A4A49_22036 [Nicotiana attenuata]|uniref:Uncharacterized protein n=1 Tax=Nicotiana attenuata TaxID=49451 RepID=A0A1J6I6A9_NICAT|nr:hypothetical protein A4A49_22036 [Nicotiana attenuata]